jgi:hypothetical protein
MATIVQEDGTDVEEDVNEATNLLKVWEFFFPSHNSRNLFQLMSGQGRPSQGLRLNGGKKQQILRAFQDDEVNTFVVYGKVVRFAANQWALNLILL